ncbi:hypothetical protein Z043_117045, partial [Scleropages formosus]
HFSLPSHTESAFIASSGFKNWKKATFKDGGLAAHSAAVMSGRHLDVQTHVKQVAKQAFYVHCNAHCLNLVLVDTVKAFPEANCFFSLSSMGEDRLNDLGILSIECRRAKLLNLDEFVDIFARNHKNRRIQML